jgi:NAD(P)-dependent dehydrogenase (short-subunit alcohol dehydrogenase family)/uncharacterized OB-fold protein
MTDPLARPLPKNPSVRTRLPLSPPAARSRAAHLLTQAAAEGRFALPTCTACGAAHYPPRDACPACLADTIDLREASPYGRLLAVTTTRVSNDSYFREHMPWRIGTVQLDAGPVVIAHVHGDAQETQRVRMSWRLDKSGQAVAMALPETDTAHMADDKQLRAMTLDPKHRRVLITDGRSAVGQAAIPAFLKAGAARVFVGVADLWKPAPELDALRALDAVDIVALDVTRDDSVRDLASSIGPKVDILVSCADHVRPGGLLDRRGLAVAREEMELGPLGLMRLAQAFGPIMTFRGADGHNSACAWVNVLSVYAQMAWPQFGGHSAMQAALWSASLSLRSALRSGGVRVVNVFSGPIESAWFQTVPPPKVPPAQLAAAIVQALQAGTEDVYVGDVAEDLRARLAANPKALERELGHS